jgi:hypothetical protein
LLDIPLYKPNSNSAQFIKKMRANKLLVKYLGWIQRFNALDIKISVKFSSNVVIQENKDISQEKKL